MWKIEYLDADGKGFSNIEPWCEEGIETEEDLNSILDGMKRRGCTDIKVIDLDNIGCECCIGDEAVFWRDGDNNAFIDSEGNMLTTVNGVSNTFRVRFCPCCGREFKK